MAYLYILSETLGKEEMGLVEIGFTGVKHRGKTTRGPTGTKFRVVKTWEIPNSILQTTVTHVLNGLSQYEGGDVSRLYNLDPEEAVEKVDDLFMSHAGKQYKKMKETKLKRKLILAAIFIVAGLFVTYPNMALKIPYALAIMAYSIIISLHPIVLIFFGVMIGGVVVVRAYEYCADYIGWRKIMKKQGEIPTFSDWLAVRRVVKKMWG